MKSPLYSVLALLTAALCLPVSAHETEEKNPDPGFRPPSDLAAMFVKEAGTATIRIFPTVIRTPTNTAFSAASQAQAVDFIHAKKLAKVIADASALDPGELQGQGQFQWFQGDLAALGKQVAGLRLEEKYVLVMEVLFPPIRGSSQAVFGIHCIILDNRGENAFSFLLNSHHQMFVDAKMTADDLSDESRTALIRKATEVGMQALAGQLQHAADAE